MTHASIPLTAGRRWGSATVSSAFRSNRDVADLIADLDAALG